MSSIPVDELDALLQDLGKPAGGSAPRKDTKIDLDEIESLMADLAGPGKSASSSSAGGGVSGTDAGKRQTVLNELTELDNLMSSLSNSINKPSSPRGTRSISSQPPVTTSTSSRASVAPTSPRPTLSTAFPSPPASSTSFPSSTSPRSPSTSSAVAPTQPPLSPRASVAPATSTPSRPQSFAPPPAAVAVEAPRPTSYSSMQPVEQRGTAGSPICASCREPIVGEFITVRDKYFHPTHLTCQHCGKTLGTSTFYELEGSPHCEACYRAVLCPKCGFCDQPIADTYITALGKKWHSDHFACIVCKKLLGQNSEPFYEKNGQPYCETDYTASFAPKCAHCNQAIIGQSINALGKSYHPEHFVCVTCSRPFNGTAFYPHLNLPYCEQHFKTAASSGSVCPGCQQLVANSDTTAITAMGKKWHSAHFKCQFCTRPLSPSDFKEKDGQAYCDACTKMMFGS